MEIPRGYVGLLFPRSSVSNKGAWLANSVGVIDSGYRGPVKVRLYGPKAPYQPGERVAQLMIMPVPYVSVQEVSELSDSQRGQGGFGSTGS